MMRKKAYCAKELDLSDDQKKSLERKVSDIDSAIALSADTIASLTDDIAGLTLGIHELDKSVADATTNRKAEHVEYNELIASNSAAKDILGMAKNRLQEFYNPKLAKSPPALVQSFDLKRASPGPPPATWNAFAKQSEANGGVVQMITLLIGDLDKQMTEAEAEERDAQTDYETLMADAAQKRAADSKSLSEKSSTKADTEALLETHTEDKASTSKQLGATMKYIASLHTECDWLVKYFDVRQQARADEVDSLKSAKAVLSGADFSLLQRSAGFLHPSI